MIHLEAPFTVDGWEETGGDVAVIRKTYSGEVVATVAADLLGVQYDDGQAYVAQERIDGTLGGRRGSFVLHHGSAEGLGSGPRQWAYVVPGSGTGELAGLRGEGRVEHGLLVLDYELPG